MFISKSRAKRSKSIVLVIKDVRFWGDVKILKNRDLAAGERSIFIEYIFLINCNFRPAVGGDFSRPQMVGFRPTARMDPTYIH